VISGEVVDGTKKEPLPFTNIVFAGKNVGTVTNAEGKFSINVSGCAATDTIIFSFLGYNTVKRTVGELLVASTVYLKENAIELNTITVRSKKLEAKEIIKKIKENFTKNYPEYNFNRKIYYHNDLKTVFNKARLELLKSNMSVVNKEFFENVNKSFPDTLYAYSDLLCNMYKYGEDSKLKPINAISLIDKWDIEGSKDVEKALNENSDDPDVYWKIRSGIIGTKIDKDSLDKDIKTDSLVLKLKTEDERENIVEFLEDNANLDNAKWEFIRKPSRYEYKIEGGMGLHNEYAYKIIFKPKAKGLYQGEMYVSTETFAILKLTYALSPERSGKSFKLFGISFKEKESFITIIYDRDSKGYFPRYIYKKNTNEFGIDRNLVLKQKKKRFGFDKTLKEIKSSLIFDLENTQVVEYLLMSHSGSSMEQFQGIKEAQYIRYRKIKNYDLDAWGDNTIIKPTEEILKYTKKLEE
jgi:hypothetical protein